MIDNTLFQVLVARYQVHFLNAGTKALQATRMCPKSADCTAHFRHLLFATSLLVLALPHSYAQAPDFEKYPDIPIWGRIHGTILNNQLCFGATARTIAPDDPARFSDYEATLYLVDTAGNTTTRRPIRYDSSAVYILGNSLKEVDNELLVGTFITYTDADDKSKWRIQLLRFDSVLKIIDSAEFNTVNFDLTHPEFASFGNGAIIHGDTLVAMRAGVFIMDGDSARVDDEVARWWRMSLSDTVQTTKRVSDNLYAGLFWEDIQYVPSARAYVTYLQGRWLMWDENFEVIGGVPDGVHFSIDENPGEEYVLYTAACYNEQFRVFNDRLYVAVASAYNGPNGAESVTVLERWRFDGTLERRGIVLRDRFDFPNGFCQPRVQAGFTPNALTFAPDGDLYIFGHLVSESRMYLARIDTATFEPRWQRSWRYEGDRPIAHGILIHPDYDGVYLYGTRLPPTATSARGDGELMLLRVGADGDLVNAARDAPRVATGAFVFPNPARDVVTVAVPYRDRVRAVEMVPVAGGTVERAREVGSGGRVALEGLLPGTYLAIGYDAAGAPVVQQQVIVQ